MIFAVASLQQGATSQLNFLLSENSLPKIPYFGLEFPTLEKFSFVANLSTYNLLCWKFATSSPQRFFNPRRRWICVCLYVCNDIELRSAGQDFLSPIGNYELHRRSFVVRCLFNF